MQVFSLEWFNLDSNDHALDKVLVTDLEKAQDKAKILSLEVESKHSRLVEWVNEGAVGIWSFENGEELKDGE